MIQSLRDKIETEARKFVLETFRNPTDEDFQVILNAMLKAAELALKDEGSKD